MVRGSGEVVQLAVAAVCVVLLQSATAASVRQEPFSLEEVTISESSSEKMKSEWASGPVLIVEYEGELITVDVELAEDEVLVPKEVYPADVVKAQISADKQYVLLAYDAKKEFRHAASARYVAYRINDERENKINRGRGSRSTDSKMIQIGGGERLQLAKWGTQGSQLVYVYQNNIYYLPSPGAEPIHITSDGVPDVVFNGILTSYAKSSAHPVNTVGRDGALSFSPDGSKLLFARNNVSLVRNANFMHYGRPGSLENQYASLVTFRYPKAGTPISTVALKMATLPSGAQSSVNIQQLLAPVDVVSEEHYLEAMAWVNDTTVMASWMNRTANVRQDVIYFVSSDPKEISGEMGLKIEQKDGWVDIYPPEFQKGSQTTTYVTILWHPHRNNVSFPHVVKVTGNTTEALTSGDSTVTKIYGWAPNGTVYYEATEESRPSTRQVYAVEEGGEPRCLSCALVSPEGNACQSAAAYFNDDLSWLALSCNGPDLPFSHLMATASNEVRKELSSFNKGMRKSLKARLMPHRISDWVEVEGLDIQFRLLLPPDLDPEGSEKRPAILSVNGYPGSQTITDTIQVDLFTYFTTNKRYVVIYIDGRGSGCKGDKTLFSVYRRLGTVEVDDQIAVTKWLVKTYPFIDGSRIGITGRGYGGYVAAMALAKDDENLFKCGVSVAPITNFIYTDISQSERYMGFPTPDDNLRCYRVGDVTRLAKRFAGKKFLLMHGTADDTVLYQNSMELAAALQDAGVLFEQQSYPDEEHLLKNLQGHEYRTIDDFFQRCFDRSALLLDIVRELMS